MAREGKTCSAGSRGICDDSLAPGPWSVCSFSPNVRVSETYVWHTAVRAPANLRLVGIDEDTRMTQGPSAAIAGDYALLRPADRLLVDQVNRGIRPWLRVLSAPTSTDQLHFVCAYLVLHNTLLKSRPDHRLLPRLLAPTPNHFPVGRLHHPQLLPLFRTFL